ncbi:MAG: L-threonylcarbamoyladenylate synthase [Gammaproteobacteria bacterium]|nr:L-threonylcarbamoyladenylate synthase [Gammaproteobacteria bacterium]
MNWKIREAVRQLEDGGIIAYPTETVYGLGCDPFNGAAVLHLLALKQRDIQQGLVLLGSSFAQLEPLLLPLTPAVKKRVAKTGPAPTTWVLPCLPAVPAWLSGKHNSLAIRITRHPVAAALCKRWGGPLVSTSANLHGKRPANNPLAVRKAFNGQLDYILHGDCGSGRPSEIRDGISGKILRNR